MRAPAVAGAVRPFVQKGAAASCDYVWVGAMQSAQFSISLYARRFSPSSAVLPARD